MKESKRRYIMKTRRRRPQWRSGTQEVPPEWNEVSDLMMENKDVLPATEGAAKQKFDEVALGRRKQRKEDDFRPKKRAHSLTVSRRM